MEIEGPIELPASANPLSEQSLLKALHNSFSRHRDDLVSSKEQLEDWASKDGYHYMLLSVVADARNHETAVRLAAIIQLKNGIDRRWRKGASNPISNQEKRQIQETLLFTSPVEVDRQIAKMMAVVAAKIARFDFPMRWEDVVSRLIAIIREGVEGRDAYPNQMSPPQLRGGLLLLLYIFKECAQVRIGPARSRLKSYSLELIILLSHVYFGVFNPELIKQGLADRERWPLLADQMEQAMLAMKIMRRAIVMFNDSIPSDENVTRVWNQSLAAFRAVVEIVFSMPQDHSTDSPSIQFLYRNLNQVAKLHVSMAREHASLFVILQHDYDVIQMHWHLVSILGQKYAVAAGYPAVSEVIGSVHDFDETRKTLIDKLGHQSLLLLRACIKMIGVPGRGLRYRTQDEKRTDNEAASTLLDKVFTESSVVELINHIVMELLLFQPNDLREWEEEPDEWEKREELGGEDFEFAVRPCAEKLLLDLTLHFKPITVPHLLKMLEAVTAPNYDSLLQKEAVYCAIGICYAFIDKAFDFKKLLEAHLIPEVQVSNPQFKILRRRIAILVGTWATIEESQGSRPIYYQLFQFLLNPEDPINDQVVRVSAGRQLYNAVNAYEATAADFLPYTDTIMNRLMSLIEEVDLPETKIALLNTIKAIVNRMEHHITPHAERLMSTLPTLWDDSGDEHLMKQLLLALISQLFFAMKADGTKYHHMVLPIIKETVTPGSKLGESLLDDALDLWATIVKQTSTPSSPDAVNGDLLALLQYVVPLMEHAAETFEKGIDILGAYTLLAPSAVLSRDILPHVLAALNHKMESNKTTASTSGLSSKAVELAWNAGVALHQQAGVEELVLQYTDTGFLETLVNGLREAYEAHQTTGPKRVDTKVHGLVETDYWALISRLAYENPQLFISALEACPATGILPERMEKTNNLAGFDLVMQWLLDEWFSHAEDVGDPSRRKLIALALTRLLELPRPYLATTHNFQSLFAMWTNVVLELTDGCDDKSVDCLYRAGGRAEERQKSAYTEEEASIWDSPDFKRLEALQETDPVFNVNLLHVIQSCLQGFVAKIGGEDVFRQEVLLDVDKEVIEGFAALGIL